MENSDPHQKLAQELTFAFLSAQKGLDTPNLFFRKYDEVYPEFYWLVSNKYGEFRKKNPPRTDF